MLKDTLQYLDLNNHLHSEIVEYQRVEHKDYNKEVIREGLLNAIIHRDYSFSGSILISVYKNRIEITSLGGLVYGLSFSDIGAGISQSRNPGLANVFYRLNVGQTKGGLLLSGLLQKGYLIREGNGKRTVYSISL